MMLGARSGGRSLRYAPRIPGLAASFSWFDTLVTARGSAGLIQAQRDYFGSHTYERIDRPGEKVHTDWPRFAERDD